MISSSAKVLHAAFLAAAWGAPEAAAQATFVNWESAHVHPVDSTPSGRRLLAVNTADARLEVFRIGPSGVTPLFDVPVGLDPVSVRARTNVEAWVANHVSNSVSVVDLRSQRVLATLATDSEPADILFAGVPERAFVSCAQANTVLVFDPEDLTAAPQRISIAGEEPRALAVSADGSEVYVAVFESGNGSTILGGGATGGPQFYPPNVVSRATGPYGGVNPPPNDGAAFDPPQKPGNPAPPAVGLIVKRDAAGRWMDDNGGDWSDLVSGPDAAFSGRPVGWELMDHDVAVIDTQTLVVDYVDRLMNINMALAVHPVSGELTVVGTDGINEVRFEPNLTGRFLRVQLAFASTTGAGTVVDLNPHLTYATASVVQAERDRSIGDPRAIVWDAAGTTAYVTGMGSNNVAVIDAAGARSGAETIEVGEGPTGAVRVGGRLYVLNKFEASISVLELATESEVQRVPFHDASPAAIKLGRRHLYGTHETSGLGHQSCASCHVDARMDRLSWDLGDPAGDVKTFDQNCPDGNCQDWHPMKGPMLTQTLRDIIGKEPFHWRGDRFGLEEFDGAFESLLGDDTGLTAGEMQEFEDFLATIHFPPNPFRHFDNSLPDDLLLAGHFTSGRFSPAGQQLPNGDAERGLALYRPPNTLDGVACVTCHTLPTGMGIDGTFNGVFQPIPPGPDGEHHLALVSVDGSTNVSIKVPHLRNLYERVGFEATQTQNVAGFGLLHDGSVDSIARFLSEPVFAVQSDQDVADLVAFMLAFSGSGLPQGSPVNPLELPGVASLDTHAAVGRQLTQTSADLSVEAATLLAQMLALADAGAVGLVAREVQRGYAYVGAGEFQTDRAGETVTEADLRSGVGFGTELTYTVVPAGSEVRVALDRDEDGVLDRDERDAGSDPADATSTPGACVDPVPAAPKALNASRRRTVVELDWEDASDDELGYRIERARSGTGAFVLVATLAPDATIYRDAAVLCDVRYDYRVRAFNCSGGSPAQTVKAIAGPCPIRPLRR